MEATCDCSLGVSKQGDGIRTRNRYLCTGAFGFERCEAHSLSAKLVYRRDRGLPLYI